MAAKVSAPGHGGGKRGRMEVTADPNVIPFIDVMLVLLIIFMIAAPISSVDIHVTMPVSKVQPSKRPPRPTWVSVSAESGGVRVFVMNDEVSWGSLGERTIEAVRTNSPQIDPNDDYEVKQQRIYIRADADLPYRNVVRTMNMLQNAGFTKIGLVAEDRR
jgi:biopolymer transport protein ExbD